MSAPKGQSRLGNWRFIMLTGAGGAFAFAAMAFLTLVLREASVSAQPAPEGPRVAHANAPLISPATSGASLHAATVGVTPEAPGAPTQSERLSGSVTHNPFGALNGGTAPPPIIAASAAPAKPAVPTRPDVKPVPALALPPAPPAPPTAPPLPFVAVGSIQGTQVTNGQPVAFIRQQEQLILVRAGDSIGQNYKVESISAQAIEFTYLPLMQRQTLALAP